jgi:hypothetical protein
VVGAPALSRPAWKASQAVPLTAARANLDASGPSTRQAPVR